MLMAIPLDFIMDRAKRTKESLSIVSRQDFQGRDNLTSWLSGHDGLEEAVESDPVAQQSAYRQIPE